MCRVVIVILSVAWRVACFLVGNLFQVIAWCLEKLYAFDWFLIFHAIFTYLSFLVSFYLTTYWRIHMASGIIDSEKVCPIGCCHCPLAPAPHPAIDHLGVFITIWHKYHGVFLQTIYFLLVVVIGGAETCIYRNRGTHRLDRIREALGNLGQLKKSLIEITILRLIVFLGDLFCDPSEVDLALFVTFVFAYLHFASVLKLLGMANDFGWLDGLVSVMLTAFEHFVRPWSYMQLLGILLTTIVVCYKNSMWSGHGKRLQPQGTQEESRELIEMTTMRSEDEVA